MKKFMILAILATVFLFSCSSDPKTFFESSDLIHREDTKKDFEKPETTEEISSPEMIALIKRDLENAQKELLFALKEKKQLPNKIKNLEGIIISLNDALVTAKDLANRGQLKKVVSDYQQNKAVICSGNIGNTSIEVHQNGQNYSSCATTGNETTCISVSYVGAAITCLNLPKY